MSSHTSKISPQEFAWALRGIPAIGGAISRDIKQTIIPYLDEVDDSARAINSVNTVIRKGDILKGYNTDALGFRVAIEKYMDDSIHKVVCYGYGGVTNVVCHVLRSMGKDVYITGRRPDMVEQKASETGTTVWTNAIQADLFVNAAPVTDLPLEETPLFLDALKGCKLAFDHEMPGKYLEDYCNNNSVHLIKGVEMYIPQMIAQWSLFLGDFIDTSHLQHIFENL
jgi:shikimate dehydrogenase